MQGPLEAGKGQETHRPLSPPEEHRPAHIWTSEAVRSSKTVLLKSLRLWLFVTAATGNSYGRRGGTNDDELGGLGCCKHFTS